MTPDTSTTTHDFESVNWTNRQGFRGIGASCRCGWSDEGNLGFEDYMDAYCQWVNEHLLPMVNPGMVP